jgi:hypothetical protein
MPIARLLILAFSFVVLFTGLGLCQTARSSIVGYVTDPAGLPVAGVKVSVTEQSTQVKTETTTNQTGYYQELDLTPGTYTVAVQAAGFQPIENRDVRVRSTEAKRVDLPLQIATAKAQVEVVAGAETIQTVNTELAGRVPHAAIEELPQAVRYTVNDTFVWAYLSLDSGAMFANGMDYRMHGGNNSPGQTVDGGVVSVFGSYNGPSGPNEETAGEVKVMTSATSAEYRQSGVFDISTKAGTNAYHGALYWYNHTDGTDARDTFLPNRSFMIENTFGGTFEGPVVLPKIYNGHNRSFFLFNYEYSPSRLPINAVSTVPTAAMRTGDLSVYPTAIKNPFVPGTTYTNNQISPLNSAANNFLKYFALPNYGPPTLLSGNWRGSLTSPQHMSFIGFRVDHHFGEKDSVFMHYNRQGYYELGPWTGAGGSAGFLPAPYPETSFYQYNNSLLGNYAHIFSPRLLNEFHYALNWYGTANLDHGAPTWSNIASLGLTGLNSSIAIPDGAVPTVSISGYTTVASHSSTDSDWKVMDYYDSLSYSPGRHTFKFGADLNTYRTEVPFLATNVLGSYTFDGRFSGNAFADYLLGLPGTASIGLLRPTTWRSSKLFGAYFTDSFRATRKLTVDYGFRDDYMPATSQDDQRNYNFDPSNGKLVVPSQAALSLVYPAFPTTIGLETAAAVGVNPGNLTRSHNRMPQPRLGFAFSPTSNLVIRAAYGLYFDTFDSAWSGLITGGPFGASLSFPNSVTSGVPFWQWPKAVPTTGYSVPGTISASGRDFDLHHSYSQQWNLTVERDIHHTIGLRISYIGSKATALQYTRNLDQLPPSLIPWSQSRQPYPLFSSVSYVGNGGNADYNALETAAEHQFRRGLFFKSTYTWAHEIGYPVTSSGSAQNTYNFRADRGEMPWDRHQKWVSLLQYQLPAGRGKQYLKSGVGSAILGNWQFGAITLFETGQWVSPSYSGFDAANTNSFSGRPDCIASVNLPHSQQTLTHWFNTSAFALPPAGRWGNCPPDMISGPGVRNFNANLIKQIFMGEHVWLKLQIDAVNVFNHPNYQNPSGTNISVPASLGNVTGQLPIGLANDFDRDGWRTLRFGLRLEF